MNKEFHAVLREAADRVEHEAAMLRALELKARIAVRAWQAGSYGSDEERDKAMNDLWYSILDIDDYERERGQQWG